LTSWPRSAIRTDADFALDFWNSDGSRAGACGNATRCVSDYMMQGLGRDSVSLVTARGGLRPCGWPMAGSR
jgi:diaminopimelate epimerase